MIEAVDRVLAAFGTTRGSRSSGTTTAMGSSARTFCGPPLPASEFRREHICPTWTRDKRLVHSSVARLPHCAQGIFVSWPRKAAPDNNTIPMFPASGPAAGVP